MVNLIRAKMRLIFILLLLGGTSNLLQAERSILIINKPYLRHPYFALYYSLFLVKRYGK